MLCFFVWLHPLGSSDRKSLSTNDAHKPGHCCARWMVAAQSSLNHRVGRPPIANYTSHSADLPQNAMLAYTYTCNICNIPSAFSRIFKERCDCGVCLQSRLLPRACVHGDCQLGEVACSLLAGGARLHAHKMRCVRHWATHVLQQNTCAQVVPV